jgi:hypothetical protein
MLFNFALEYTIKKVQENQMELKFNGTHQLLAYVDDVNLLGDNTDTTKKNTETFIGSCKEIGLKINIEKAKHLLLSHHLNAFKNPSHKIANKLFENVSQFKYWERQ